MCYSDCFGIIRANPFGIAQFETGVVGLLGHLGLVGDRNNKSINKSTNQQINLFPPPTQWYPLIDSHR